MGRLGPGGNAKPGWPDGSLLETWLCGIWHCKGLKLNHQSKHINKTPCVGTSYPI